MAVWSSRGSGSGGLRVRRRRCVWGAAAAVCWAALAGLALAAAGDIAADARRVAAEISAAKQAGRFGVEAERAAVEQIGELVLRFLDAADRAALRGEERDAGVRAAYEAIAPALDGIYEANAARLDRLAKSVMDEDGDLEALYETPEWRDGQRTATQALYYRNWLHFNGARLYEKPRREALLRQAERGFSEFAVGERESELLIESVLGRGLCHLELGNTDWAERDFRTVIDAKDASAPRRSRAKIALLEAYLRAGRVDKSLAASAKFAAGPGGELRPEEAAYLRFLRLKALMLAVRRGGAGADGYRAEALALVDQLRGAGGAWRDRAEALLAASIDDPARWAGSARNAFAQWNVAKLLVEKGEYARAAPLLAAVLRSEDAEMKGHHAEAAYWLGVGEFRAGDYVRAAEHLQASTRDDAAHRADARYLRFKALEAVMAGGAAPELAPAFRTAAAEYAAEHPDHRSVYEAYYRLGELLQAEGKFAEAIAMYAKVAGDPVFELRSRFATLQSQFELLRELPARGPEAARRPAVLEAIGALLPAVDAGARALRPGDGAPAAQIDQMLAKTAVMQAAYLGMTGGGDEAILDAVRDYERTYPAHADLFPTVLRMRLEALRRLGRFAEADAEVTAHGAAFAPAELRETADALARLYSRAAARAARGSETVAADAARVVARKLYEIALDGGTSGKRTARLTLARLYEQTGAAGKAAPIYEELLRDDPAMLAARRGLAGLAEQRGDLPAALDQWGRFSAATRPGDPPWYEGQYQVARLTLASGDRTRSCTLLTELQPAMPGLGDADLRAKLGEIYGQACR